MTLAYIIFNIPYIAVVKFLLTSLIGTVNETGLTVEEYLEEYTGGSYVVAVLSVLFVSLNGLVNSLIYYWRIKHYREWVRGVWRRRSERSSTVGCTVELKMTSMG